MRVWVLAVVLLACPVLAQAVTLRDLVELHRAGLSDDVLEAVIDADRTVFVLSPREIVDLHGAGLSDRLVVKILNTRREFGTSLTPAAPMVDLTPPVVLPGAIVIPSFVPWFPVRQTSRPAIQPRQGINMGLPIRNGEFLRPDPSN